MAEEVEVLAAPTPNTDLNTIYDRGRATVRYFENGPAEVNFRSLCYVDTYRHATEFRNFVQVISSADNSWLGAYVRQMLPESQTEWVRLY